MGAARRPLPARAPLDFDPTLPGRQNKFGPLPEWFVVVIFLFSIKPTRNKLAFAVHASAQPVLSVRLYPELWSASMSTDLFLALYFLLPPWGFTLFCGAIFLDLWL